jgi:quinolinate synthase
MVKEALLPTATLLSPYDPVATVPLNEQLAFSRWQQDIPDDYRGLDAPQLVERIADAKAKLAERLVILGHHYQRDDVIRFADQRGDSFKLARWAAANPQADHIVFCGVHFMAESADILCAPHQSVVLPNMTAGCSMADMASLGDVMSCWDELAATGLSHDTLPVTYINSTAALKAFCGERGGVVCTSSNAPAVFQWALTQKRRVLFFPDEHLGRVTGRALGVPLAQMPVWDRRLSTGSLGGNDIATLRDSRIILWNGYCGVHQRFTVDQVRRVREQYPGVRVVVHPECRLEVVEAADSYGSTEHIIRAVGQSPAGSRWAVGTEINLVGRLAREHRDKTVLSLDPDSCPCSTMYRIHPAYLCWVLERLVDGEVVNRVTVEPETARWAKLALERMLAISC